MPSRIVILSQVYVPDPASVGQHIHDLAAELVKRGHEVVVYCSSRGYDKPDNRYPRDEVIEGVKVHRYSLPVFSKTSMPLRVFGSAWAMLSLFMNSLFTRNTSLIIFSTSPPLVGVVANVVARIKGVKTVFWAMDLNPDQLLAMKKLREGSITHRFLETANRFVLRGSELIVPLDRFMAGRISDRPNVNARLLVLPPWSHEKIDTPLPHDQNEFRQEHDLNGKFVVMYSGNHSPANPLDTLLKAILAFKDDDSIRFFFVGGGIGKKQVEEHIKTYQLTNCVSLAYQPLAKLRHSLSAADVHVVSLGPEMVGIIHPCKVYGAMAMARPVLFFGPSPSHVSDLIDKRSFGVQVNHGEVDQAVAAIHELKSRDLGPMGNAAQDLLRQGLDKDTLCAAMCDGIESLLAK